MEDALKSGIHGFRTWVDFLKATVALGLMLSAGLWAILSVALDDRYAPKNLADQVAVNGNVATQVQGQLKILSDVVIGEAAFAKKIQYCEADAQGESSRKNDLSRQLGVLIQQYRALVGRDPYLPDC